MPKQILETPFNIMKSVLENSGFKLEQDGYAGDGLGFFFDGFGVTGYIGEPSGKQWYWQLDGKIVADNALAFNKWTQCPLVVWLPDNYKTACDIIEAIKFLGTEEGFKISNEFGSFDYGKYGLEMARNDQ